MTGLHDSDNLQSHKPDPTVERIFRKLLYLIVISIIMTLLLVCAVLVVIIYKTTRSVASPVNVSSINQPKERRILMGSSSDPAIILSPGAQLVSQNLSRNLISLEVLNPDNSTELIIYDYREGSIFRLLQIPADGTSHFLNERKQKKITGK